MGAVLATVAVALAVVVAGAVGTAAVAVVAVVVGLAAVVDGARLLGRVGARPVLPAAVVPVVALPVLAAGDAATTWAQVGSWYAGAFVLAAALMLVSGRRHHAALGLGATMAVAALAGLGAVGLVLVRELPAGSVWLVVLVLLVVAGDLPDRAARSLMARSGRGRSSSSRVGAVAAVAGTVFVTAATATALADTTSPLVIVAVAAIAVVAGRVASALWPSGLPSSEAPARPLAPGGPLAASGTLLLAAPLAYLVVRVGAV